MDLSPSIDSSAGLTCDQAIEHIIQNNAFITSSPTHTTSGNKQNSIKKRTFSRSINNCKTLFVSGLKSSVNIRDLRKYFIGCIKVTLKQYHSISHLKYAFVDYRTPDEAGRSFHRSIDRSLLGRECHIEYGNRGSNTSNKHQSVSNNKVVVSRIPENVSEHDLCHLFSNGHILKYCPARRIHQSNTTTKTTNNDKILSGYAFILYDNEQQAASVIEHADQYRINGQLLVVSLYRHQNHRIQ